MSLLPALQPVVFDVQSNSTESPLRIVSDVSGEYDSVPAVKDTDVRFELSDYVRSLFTDTEPMTATTPQLCDFACKAIIFKFWEKYGNPPALHNSFTADTCYALLAKIPEARKVEFYKIYSGLHVYLIQSKSALSWWNPGEWKRVIPGFPEFIYYLQALIYDGASITPSIVLYFTDGTTAGMTSPFNYITINYMKCYYYPVGYNELGIEAWVTAHHPGKTLSGYTVQLKRSNNTDMTPVYKFKLDTGYYPGIRQLWFRNPFGVYETILLTGLGTSTSETKPEIAETDGLDMPGKLTWKNTLTRSMKANTGWMTKMQVQWLTELMDTTEVLEYIDGVLHPVIMKENKILPVHDSDYQFQADLEWEYAPMNYIDKF